MEKFKTHNGKEYTFRFASLRQVRKVGVLLGIDILKDGLTKLDFVGLLGDEEKVLALMKQVVTDEVNESCLEDFTLGDFQGMLYGFFLKGKTLSVQFGNELSVLRNIINIPLTESQPQQDTRLTSPSIPVLKEIPKA
jgi:hypothetical protein